MMESTETIGSNGWRLARRAAWIVLVFAATAFAFVEMVWHLEIFLKLLPG